MRRYISNSARHDVDEDPPRCLPCAPVGLFGRQRHFLLLGSGRHVLLYEVKV